MYKQMPEEEVDSKWDVVKHWRGPVPFLRDEEHLRSHKRWNPYAAYVLLIAVIILELYTATIGILLSVDTSKTTWIVYISTGWLRVLFFTIASILLDPLRWWVQWIKLDDVMVTGVGAVCAYSFFVLSVDKNGYTINAVICYAFLIFSLSGEIRLMAKYFPFNKWSIFFYKLVRAYAFIFYVLTELTTEYLEATGHHEEGEGEEADAKKEQATSSMHLIFIAVSLKYLHSLFELVAERGDEMNAEKREEREERESKRHSEREMKGVEMV